MRTRGLLVALLLVLSLAPVASAELIYVPRTYDGTGNTWANASEERYRTISFNFDTDFYDTSTYTNDSISNTIIQVNYQTDRAGFQSFLPTFTNFDKQYDTRLLINGTDYINWTTTYHKPACIFTLCSAALEVCHSFTYAGPTRGNGALIQTQTGNTTCTSELFGYPNGAYHQITLRSVVNADRPELRIAFPHAAADGNPQFESLSLALGVPSRGVWDSRQMRITNLTNYTNSVSLTTNAQDATLQSTTVNYQFYTWANGTLENDRADNATGTSGPGAFESIMKTVFDGAHTLFSFLFGIFPGGKEAAEFISTLVTVLIGIPLFAITIFISNPAKFLLYHTVFFLALGTVRYASSTASEVNVIWSTGLDLVWKPLFRITRGFTTWTIEKLVHLAQIITSNTTVLVILVGAAILGITLTLGLS